MKYRTANEYYREKFGCKIYRLSIDAGFTCPNRDGTLGVVGCIFCDGSGAFSGRGETVTEQLSRARALVSEKNKGGKYIAYFQAFTNTYAPCETLRELYDQAIAPEDIVGLAIGTRPDCLGDDVLALLAEINRIKPVAVELGLQTCHEKTAVYIRRGYPFSVYEDAVRRLKQNGIEVITHIIIGLPGETPQMAAQTTQAAVSAGTDGVKFHMLHVLRGTDLEKAYLRGDFRCMTLEEYGKALECCLRQLPPHIVVHRITGDGAKKDLIAPLWSGNKKRVLNYLNRLLHS